MRSLPFCSERRLAHTRADVNGDGLLEDYCVHTDDHGNVGALLPFAVRDGNLITGQQQNSGGEVAKTVIEALGR